MTDRDNDRWRQSFGGFPCSNKAHVTFATSLFQMTLPGGMGRKAECLRGRTLSLPEPCPLSPIPVLRGHLRDVFMHLAGPVSCFFFPLDSRFLESVSWP